MYSGDEDGVGARLTVRLRGPMSFVVRVAMPGVTNGLRCRCEVGGLKKVGLEGAACRRVMIHTRGYPSFQQSKQDNVISPPGETGALT